jgi:hypothetical protein
MASTLTSPSQAALYFQIIAKAGPVKWDELTLPEGRTSKACQVASTQDGSTNV